jgi:hypothetical protein
MKNLDDGATTGFAASAMLLIPILLICALPVALGIGCDIIGAAGEAPVALAIGAPAAAVLCSALLGAATPRIRARREVVGDAD